MKEDDFWCLIVAEIIDFEFLYTFRPKGGKFYKLMKTRFPGKII